jgi:uncharacterized protein (DUF1015 family)
VTRIEPFAALRYDTSRVDLARALAPPYDVVAAEERGGLYERDPHNAVRLELTRDVAEESTTDYAQVRGTLDAWRREGVLVRDERPALYGLRQRFTAPDGAPRVRDGFFGLLHLEDYEKRIVRPHERTLAAPKADRLKLLRAVRANLSPVLLLYADREGELDAFVAPEEEIAAARDESGTHHLLTRIDDPARIAAASAFLAGRPVVIADGHHRYETALAYRDECRGRGAGEDAACEWILACFANAYAPGNLLLPIHRLIRKGTVPTEAAWAARLPAWRQQSVAVASAEDVPGLLVAHLAPLADRHAFAVDDASGRLRIFSRARTAPGELGVSVIHREVVAGVFGLDERAVREGAIDYPKDAARTARELRLGRGVAALYLNPLTADDVFRATAAGEVLPQKSTFFYPKLPTGLVFRLLEDAA